MSEYGVWPINVTIFLKKAQMFNFLFVEYVDSDIIGIKFALSEFSKLPNSKGHSVLSLSVTMVARCPLSL